MNILYIDMSRSECGACGRNADPNEKAHVMTNMRGEGCGDTFTAVSSHYAGTDERVKQMRPDLAFVDFGGLPEVTP